MRSVDDGRSTCWLLALVSNVAQTHVSSARKRWGNVAVHSVSNTETRKLNVMAALSAG